MRLFTRKQHVNTLAPLDDKSLWVVLHNLGKVGQGKGGAGQTPLQETTSKWLCECRRGSFPWLPPLLSL